MAALFFDLLRHGDALPAGPEGDRSRPLSPSGRRQLARLGARLAGEFPRYDHVLSSPFLRATETAEVVAAAFAEPVPVEILEDLTPDSTPTRVLQGLRRLGIGEGHALLVGHQPLLGQLALLLTGAETRFAPGSLVRVRCAGELAAGAGRILLAHHPGPER